MNLRHYETFYLLRPDLSEEDRGAIHEKFQNVIRERGGEIVKLDPWPLRRLAYRVHKQAEGYYVLMEYGAPPDAMSELVRTLRLDERVIKFISNKLADVFDREAILQAQKAKVASRQEAESGASATEETVPPQEEAEE